MDPSSAEAGREKAWCMDTFNSLCSSYDYHRHINQRAKIACPCFWTLLFCPLPLPPSYLCATAFITFDLFPVFVASAEMEMVKLIALLEEGGSRFPGWEFANFPTIAKMLPQSRVAAHTPDVCNLWEQQLKGGKFVDVRNRPPVVTLPGTKSIISWWIWHLSLDMRAARARTVQTKRESCCSSRRCAIEDPLK